MKSFLKKGLTSAGAFALPFLALAQDGAITSATSFDTLFDYIAGFLNNATGLIVAIAFVLFIFGLLKYIRSAGDEKSRGEAKNIMVYGIIIMFLMISVWGFVKVLNNAFFGGTTQNIIDTPTISI
jgi:hypothetical protein